MENVRSFDHVGNLGRDPFSFAGKVDRTINGSRSDFFPRLLLVRTVVHFHVFLRVRNPPSSCKMAVGMQGQKRKKGASTDGFGWRQGKLRPECSGRCVQICRYCSSWSLHEWRSTQTTMCLNVILWWTFMPSTDVLLSKKGDIEPLGY